MRRGMTPKEDPPAEYGAGIGSSGETKEGAFKNSPLGIKLNSNSLNLPEPKELGNYSHKLPYVIVGDDAFTLKEYLMKPYSAHNLTYEKRIFNYRLSRARRTVENAFGILANRFRVLLNPIRLSVEKVEQITYTCVLLHNFLLTKRCHWYVPQQCRGENPEIVESGLAHISSQGGNRCTLTAIEVREKYREYFNTCGTVTWQRDAISRGNY